LDPFHSYTNTIDDQVKDAVAVLDAFHVVDLGARAVDGARQTWSGLRSRAWGARVAVDESHEGGFVCGRDRPHV
jgi:transposase